MIVMTPSFESSCDALDKVYSVASQRAIDTLAIKQIGDDGFELMRRAGKAAWQMISASMQQAEAEASIGIDQESDAHKLGDHELDDDQFGANKSLLVLAGAGNNGGDAWVVAYYAKLAGMEPLVVTVGDQRQLSSAAQKARDWALKEGVNPISSEQWLETYSYDENQPSWVVDGLFGIGLSRPIEGQAKRVIEAVNQLNAHVLSLDLPSGIEADTGSVLGCAIRADQTLSFIGLSAGAFTQDGPDYVGCLSLDTLSIAPECVVDQQPLAQLVSYSLLPSLPERVGNSHKGSFGKVALIGGDLGMGGAIMLSSMALARTGVGLMQVITRQEHVPLVLQCRPECMVQPFAEGEALHDLCNKVSVLALGPGLGQSEWAKSIMKQAMNKPLAATPKVLDADALNILANAQYDVAEAMSEMIITPHPGEAARLLGKTIAQVQADRLGSAQLLADRYRCIVILKGQGSVIAAPSSLQKTAMICLGGNPGMASGGMGDVLTGIIAGLWAQGLSAWEAAIRGVCLHAEAGDQAAEIIGQRGLLASDLVDYLPQLLH